MKIKERFEKARELEKELESLEATEDIPKEYQIGSKDVNESIIWAINACQGEDIALKQYKAYLEMKENQDSKGARKMLTLGLYFKTRLGIGFLRNYLWDERGYEWVKDDWELDYNLFKKCLEELPKKDL